MNDAQVNGLNIYYEIHGTGEPLILLSAPEPEPKTETKQHV